MSQKSNPYPTQSASVGTSAEPAASPAVAGFRPASVALAVAAAFAQGPALGQAQLPTGLSLLQGAATVTQQGNLLLVNAQNAAGTNRSVLGWSSFSIGRGFGVDIHQANAQSLSINLVKGNDPSSIFGTLSSNGRLVLVNPSGIAVGAGAVVDTAGFTASTLRMSDADAMAGRLRFSNDGNAGPLTVSGNVISRGGDVVLIAPNVEVAAQAVVQAQGGAAILAAGQAVEITGRGLEGIVMQVQAPADKAVNLGTLKGDAVGIFAGTLRHSGLIQAQTATLEGGKVVLKALASAEVTPGARIDANGTSGGQVSITALGGDAKVAGTITASAETGQGGTIQVLAKNVRLEPGAALEAAGDAGGGTILVGGDAHGASPDVANATTTAVAAGVTLNADARVNGDGGKVIVWADNATAFDGTISARGGEQGGNGGFGETSGRNVLYFGGTADLSARRGRRGTLLLDPTNITVAGTAGINNGVGGDIVNPADLGNAGSFPGNSQITASALTGLLNTSDVTLAATNNISVNSAVSKTGSVATTLTLTAPTISINSTIGSSSGALNLALNGAATLNSTYKNGTLTTSSGSLAGNGTFDNVTVGGNLALTGGSFLIANGLTLANGVTLDRGSMSWYLSGSPTIATSGGARRSRARAARPTSTTARRGSPSPSAVAWRGRVTAGSTTTAARARSSTTARSTWPRAARP